MPDSSVDAPRPLGWRPVRGSQAELRESGSRFLAFVSQVGGEREAERRRARLAERFTDATHVCFAWRLDAQRTRSGDDGEPAGTAGSPMLQALESAQLVETLAVVVRYYGGTKLGRGGLLRAYGGAVRAALEELELEPVYALCRLFIETDYRRFGSVERLARPPVVQVVEPRFAEQVRAELRVEESMLPEVEARLSDLGVTFRRSD